MHTDWHPQDWIMIVGALSALNHERDRGRDERAKRIYELQEEIAWMHGFKFLSDFVLQAEM